MAPQTSYALAQAVGRVGAISRSSRGINADTKIATVPIPLGCLVVRDTDDLKAKLPTSAGEVLSASKGSGGVAIANHTIITADGPNDPVVPTVPVGKEFAALRKGSIFVTVEENVVQGDQAYARFGNSPNVTDGTQNQKGAWRKSPDGAGSTAQVSTLTPTAANTTVYAVEVINGSGQVIATAEYQSDADATATEIVAGLKAALGTVPGVDLSGTTTLIMTAHAAGVPFTVRSIGDGVITIAATTPNVTGAPSAAMVSGAYFQTSAAAGTLAELRVAFGAT